MKINKKYYTNQLQYWIEKKSNLTWSKLQSRKAYEAVSEALMDVIREHWNNTEKKYITQDLKSICYFSAEFLMGRSLSNNLHNLGYYKDISQILQDVGINLTEIEDDEPDAGLGNGGLGRLAACFMESLATLSLPAKGYGIRYKYGMFRQKIMDGRQCEFPDDWNAAFDPWSIRKDDLIVTVQFGGTVETVNNQVVLKNTERVRAIPYDVPVIGDEGKSINTLRLWEAESESGFDLGRFNNMDYLNAMEACIRAEDISRVLYPNDNGHEGKKLRLRQQYFFTSASLQNIIYELINIKKKDLSAIPNYICIQLNDTHPVIAIPELMRLLVDEYKLEWDKAWNIVINTFAYTNHTVMVEAMEQWHVDLVNEVSPRILQIIEKINQQFLDYLNTKISDNPKLINNYSIIRDGMIRMLNLAIVSSFSVNGVAKLHTKILKTKVLKDWYELMPQKFNNKTNGITPRRWIKNSNLGLSDFLSEAIGSDWCKNLNKLENLKQLADDHSVLKRLEEIKAQNKLKLSKFIKTKTGILVNPDSLYDVQIKRLHEYKRQLLNVLSLIHDWQEFHDDPDSHFPKRTIIFSAKAASGYHRAKKIIHLIHCVAKKINSDPLCKNKLKIVFIPDYKVSIAELIIPAAELSQQISTAGKEASGTGNMKLMLNGAITIGTMDGANIEIVEAVGEENAFIFGLNADQIAKMTHERTYNPLELINKSEKLKQTINTLIDGTFTDSDEFREIYDSLLFGVDGAPADQYFVLQDFSAYCKARKLAGITWQDQQRWNKMSLYNIANGGRFSSDRTIGQYASEIWKIKTTD